MQMTQIEMSTLRSFGDEWASGDGNWIVDHLACRGMLERGMNVGQSQALILPSFVNPLVFRNTTTRQTEKGQRAEKRFYKLTRRGRTALKHAEITD